MDITRNPTSPTLQYPETVHIFFAEFTTTKKSSFEANEKSNNPFEKSRPKSGHKGDIGSFLEKGKLIPDSKIQVRTKALAIGCLTYAITMASKVFLQTGM